MRPDDAMSELDEAFAPVGGEISRLSVALRVMGEPLDPSEINRLLGAQGLVPELNGAPRPGISLYQLNDPPSPQPTLHAVLESLLARLTQDMDVWQELGRRYKMDVFCGWFMGRVNEGADLPAATLRALAARGLDLSLDVYGPPTETDQTRNENGCDGS
jgi:hypothetical protein